MGLTDLLRWIHKNQDGNWWAAVPGIIGAIGGLFGGGGGGGSGLTQEQRDLIAMEKGIKAREYYGRKVPIYEKLQDYRIIPGMLARSDQGFPQAASWSAHSARLKTPFRLKTSINATKQPTPPTPTPRATPAPLDLPKGMPEWMKKDYEYIKD